MLSSFPLCEGLDAYLAWTIFRIICYTDNRNETYKQLIQSITIHVKFYFTSLIQVCQEVVAKTMTGQVSVTKL